MAAVNPKVLQGELTCSVCLDYFEDPVFLDCGHTFCRACITHYWEGLRINFNCPECREAFSQRSFKPNRHLRNIVEASRRLPLELRKEPKVERRCEKHKEALALFCQVDQMAICIVCTLSRDHKGHTVVPIGEADEEYQDLIQSRLEILRKQRKEILSFKLSEKNKIQETLRQLETEKHKIVYQFQKLCQFLKEQEQLMLAQLEDLNKEIKKKRDEYIAKLSQEISSISDLISEMEQKCQLPANEFLEDIKGTLSRCEREKFQNPVTFSSELKWRIWENSQKNASLKAVMEKFKDLLLSRQQLDKVNVTLDQDTAQSDLVLGADRRSVKWGRWQDLPNNPERFDTVPCVLGCEGFTSGRHYWEVEVAWRGHWAVGLVRESVQRKGRISFTPEQGIWAVQCIEDRYWALTCPEPGTPLFLNWGPRRIRVYLDYDEGQVVLFDAGNGAPIFSFLPASFAGERLRPFFRVGPGGHFYKFMSQDQCSQITLCP